MRRVILVIAVLVAACASGGGQWHYDKPGADYQEYVETRNECAQKHTMAYSGAGAYVNAYAGGYNPRRITCLNGGMFDSCMAVAGWSRVDPPAGFVAPGEGITTCPDT